MSRSLTVNYGLRWDLETGLENVIAQDFKSLGPRVGLAYAPGGKTVFRAGFGIFFDRFSLPFVFVTLPEIPGVTLPGVVRNSASAGWVLNQLLPGPGGCLRTSQKTFSLMARSQRNI